jgi:hypothetical protein
MERELSRTLGASTAPEVPLFDVAILKSSDVTAHSGPTRCRPQPVDVTRLAQHPIGPAGLEKRLDRPVQANRHPLFWLSVASNPNQVSWKKYFICH